jgi:hypothetical protein
VRGAIRSSHAAAAIVATETSTVCATGRHAIRAVRGERRRRSRGRARTLGRSGRAWCQRHAKVNEVNYSKLGASEAASKSDQQQSPIAEVFEPITRPCGTDKEVLTEERLGLPLRCSRRTANAAHRRPDQRTSRRVWEALGLECDRNRGKTSRQGRGLQDGGVIGEVLATWASVAGRVPPQPSKWLRSVR